MGNSAARFVESDDRHADENLQERFIRTFFSTTATAVLNTRSNNILDHYTENDCECNICLVHSNSMLQTTRCFHKACAKCWLRFFCSSIEAFAMARLNCIECKEGLNPSAVINLLEASIKNPSSVGIEQTKEDQAHFPPDSLKIILQRFEEFLLQRSLFHEPNIRWCPIGCGYGFIGQGFENCPEVPCEHPNCNGRPFCYNCQRPWLSSKAEDSSSESIPNHVCSSDEVAASRMNAVQGLMVRMGVRRIPARRVEGQEIPITPTDMRHSFLRGTSVDSKDEIASSSMDKDVESDAATQQLYDEIIQEGMVKPCPRCGAMIMKQEGCNHMACSRCGYDFCWLCLGPNTASHHFGLSGCTFFAEERLTLRTRTGILIGLILLTPIGLALIGVLSPIIGMAALAYCSFIVDAAMGVQNKHLRRFLSVLFFVLFTFILGPIAGVLAFAIILLPVLGFIYIYLPITYCKAVTPSNQGVVFTDFDPSGKM